MRSLWHVLLIIGCGDGSHAHARTLYLNFEGAALATGRDDASQNRSEIALSPTTLSSYLGSDANRAMKISAIAAEVATILAPFDVEVVMARPTSGPYMMVVTTDAASDALGLIPLLAASSVECGAVDSPVAFIFGSGTEQPIHSVSTDTIAMLGLSMLGVPTSAVPDDCMCFSDANCTFPPDRPCSIGGPGTAISAAKPGCATTATVMDENALFLAGFGPRP
jgi:hypothetical protein